MSQTYERITPALREFIESQRMFFVATAPLSAEGHVNLSPKGLDTFRVIDDLSVAYLDLTGSGNETSAHVEENARITFMFCAFEGPPKILRLYGRGTVVLPKSDRWAEVAAMFPERPGARQIVIAAIDRVATSCGFGVPRYAYVEERNELTTYYLKKGPAGMEQYRREKNAKSIDGLLTPFGRTL